MIFIILILIILFAWYKDVWKLHFLQTHSTMLYFAAMNLLYLFLTKDTPLWLIQAEFGIPNKVIEMLYSFIVFPLTALLFLSNFPQHKPKIALHIGKWIAIYIIVEMIAYLTGRITYSNGWNIGWSFLFLLIMFPMLRLHSRKPLLAYGLSIIIIWGLMYFFNIPWKHEVGFLYETNKH